VLAAHVNWRGDDGRFRYLEQVDPGDGVQVTLDDGTVLHYLVVERAKYDKYELPADRIWTNEGPETLVLITCGGRFNESARRYRDNIVVYAVPDPAAG
jgi:hypothetical protein